MVNNDGWKCFVSFTPAKLHLVVSRHKEAAADDSSGLLLGESHPVALPQSSAGGSRKSVGAFNSGLRSFCPSAARLEEAEGRRLSESRLLEVREVLATSLNLRG